MQTIDASVVAFDTDRAGSTVRGVTTPDVTVATTAVVVAGGAWSDQMAALLGVRLPVVPLKGQIIHLALPDTDSRDWCIVQPVLGFYLVPWADGRVACGGTMEAHAGFDHRPTADGVHQLLRECLRIAPGLAQATVADIRVGSRPATPDSRPILGRLPGWSNVFVATGHGAEGLLLGPYSARLVAGCVLGQSAVPETRLVRQLVRPAGNVLARAVRGRHRRLMAARAAPYQSGDHELVRSSLLSHWSRISRPLAM